jgi:membrane protein YqaA with SNARE-associated domain
MSRSHVLPGVPTRWLFISFLLIASVLAVAVLAPASRRLGFIGLYVLGSHVLMTPLPQEPIVFYSAQFYSVLLVTTIMTLGACLAGVFDYAVLSPLLARENVRAALARSRFFRHLAVFFGVSPFWLLVAVNFSPLPLSPFKLLSIAERYPLWKYESSLLLGRAPRYFVLALLGYALKPPVWSLALLVVVMLVGSVFARRRTRIARPALW